MATVFVSSVVPAPVERVWSKVRDFNALPEWVPLVKSSAIESGLPSDRVGCVRAFTTQDGQKLRERLLALSDRDHSVTYSILESHMPVRGYVATLRFLPITDGDRTYAEWTASFDCPPDAEKELVERIGRDVFQAAFDRLRTFFA
jgi:hypothetical protein